MEGDRVEGWIKERFSIWIEWLKERKKKGIEMILNCLVWFIREVFGYLGEMKISLVLGDLGGEIFRGRWNYYW